MLVSVYRDNLISISDLINSIQKLQKISDSTKFEKIAKVLDADKDGVIDYSNAMEVSGPLLPHESCTTWVMCRIIPQELCASWITYLRTRAWLVLCFISLQ